MVLILLSTKTPFLRNGRFVDAISSQLLTGLQLLFADQGTVQKYVAERLC